MILDRVDAKRIVLDKVNNLLSQFERKTIIRGELCKIINWLNDKGLTSVFTSGEPPYGGAAHGLEEHVSDCVIHLKHHYKDHIGTRYMTIKKYRGSEHRFERVSDAHKLERFVIIPHNLSRT